MTERSSPDSDSDFWMAERGMKVRLEAQAPSGKWIAIFPAQLDQMIQQGAPVRATEVDAVAGDVQAATPHEPAGSEGVRDPLIGLVANLAAAISLLERTPKAKKAAPSDTMFEMMLSDYRKALDAGREFATKYFDAYEHGYNDGCEWEATKGSGRVAQPSLGHSALIPTPEQIEPILDDYLGVECPHYEEMRRRCAQRIFDLCAVMSGLPITNSDNRISEVGK